MASSNKITNDDIYEYLKNYYNEYGLMPKYETVARHFHLARRDSVHYHIRKLQQRGLLDEQRMFTQPIHSDCIQVIGDVAAGEPIESADIIDEIDLQQVLDAQHTFWLRIKGDSMYEMGINDGDYVQIKKINDQQQVRNKDIVVAQVKEAYECTLKEYQRHEGQIALIPKNPALSTQHYRDDEIQVLGKYTGIVIQNQYFR